ncbi:MAG TPA: ThiF family adenylyltransferase, partial [Bdellovibrio sp.]|nr:ThiF family adenylyltransferase [Bdellovibrio sp.]
NPNLEIKAFSEGVQEQNMDAFLNGVDIFVDGLDVYEIDIRRKVFMECHRRGIPVVTVGPVGMGGALLNFLPGQMSFDDYFGINSQQSLEEKFARFLVGLTPSFIHMKAMADISSINPKERKAPSTPMGCYLAAGIMGSEVLKILLKRGKVYAAPYSLQFDAYSNVLKKKCFWGGAKNPLFQLRLWIFKRLMKARNKK